MISLTGGFNQAYASGAPKVQKLKYASDVMGASDTLVVAVTVQHFRNSYADALTLLDAAGSALDYVADIEHGYSDNLSLNDAIEATIA
jgi:hypothetical protein